MDGSHEGIAIVVFCCRTAIESFLKRVQWETNIYNPFKTLRNAETVSVVLLLCLTSGTWQAAFTQACNTWYLPRQASGEQAKTKRNREDCFASLDKLPSSELQVRIQNRQSSLRHVIPNPRLLLGAPLARAHAVWLPNVTQTPAACDRPS